jgi:thiamine pyrophosphokinase
MHFTIFANGEFSQTDLILPEETEIIAADGGVQHCLQLGLIPDVLIGDFDSITEHELESFKSKDIIVKQFPTEKNETDLELALIYAKENGATKITLFGLLGGRWDMSLANVLLLASDDFKEISIRAICRNLDIYVVRGGETLTLYGNPGNTISVLPLSPCAEGITYTGLAWNLKNSKLPFGSPRGISNYLIEDHAQISLKKGVLIVLKEDKTP